VVSFVLLEAVSVEMAFSLSGFEEGEGGLLLDVPVGLDVSFVTVEAGKIFTDGGGILDTSSPDLTVKRLFFGLVSVVVVD